MGFFDNPDNYIVKECWASPEITLSQNGSATVEYLIKTKDRTALLLRDADLALRATIGELLLDDQKGWWTWNPYRYPDALDGYNWQGHRLQRKADHIYRATVTYGTGEPVQMRPRVQFNTTGGTQHITQSITTVNRYALTGTPPDFGGAINVSEGRVEGVDITVPVYEFQQTNQFHIDDIPTGDAWSYRRLIKHLTGKVNEYEWFDFYPGELLFLGATGGNVGADMWEFTYHFAASDNREDITVGAITNIDKKGWEYMWIRYSAEVDDSAQVLVQRPRSVHVEQVYAYGDLAQLEIDLV